MTDSQPLTLPCGGCLGCRTSAARAWALRCQLELQDHRSATFNTLTYSDETLPPTLQKRHLQLWLKRLRQKMGPARPIRYFASGEYGEKTARPHYHAILYGAHQTDAAIIEDTWQLGHTRTDVVTPASIAYVAGYTQKKIGYLRDTQRERIDLETGEVYQWQPSFIQMSRNPGIGGSARQYVKSWRLYAVHAGHILPVPRFLHNAWKKQATQEEQDELDTEKQQQRTRLQRDNSKERLEAREQIEQSKQREQANKRKY